MYLWLFFISLTVLLPTFILFSIHVYRKYGMFTSGQFGTKLYDIKKEFSLFMGKGWLNFILGWATITLIIIGGLLFLYSDLLKPIYEKLL